MKKEGEKKKEGLVGKNQRVLVAREEGKNHFHLKRAGPSGKRPGPEPEQGKIPWVMNLLSLAN